MPRTILGRKMTRSDGPIEHIGVYAERLDPTRKAMRRELLFSTRWKALCEDGFLQSLFLKSNITGIESDTQPLIKISQRDATIAATLIQFLGSPRGFSMLEKLLEEAGYRISPIQTSTPEREDSASVSEGL